MQRRCPGADAGGEASRHRRRPRTRCETYVASAYRCSSGAARTTLPVATWERSATSTRMQSEQCCCHRVIHSLKRRGRGRGNALAGPWLHRLRQRPARCETPAGFADATMRERTRTPCWIVPHQQWKRWGYGCATDDETAEPQECTETRRNDTTRTPAAREKGRGTGQGGTGRFP